MKTWFNIIFACLMIFVLASCPSEPEETVDAEFSFSVYVNGVPVESFPYICDFGAVPVFQVSGIVEIKIVNTSESDSYGLQFGDGGELFSIDNDDFINRYGAYTTASSMPISPFHAGESTYIYFAYNPRKYGASTADIQIPISRNGDAEDLTSAIKFHFTGETTVPSAVGDIFNFLEIPTSSGAAYSSPSFYNGYLFIGTSRPLAEPMASDNCFCKLDTDFNIIWSSPLGFAEVLGGTAFDSIGDAYFVVRTNRGIDDVSQTRLFLKKLSGDTGAELFTVELPPFRDEVGVIYWNPAIANTDTIGTGDDIVYVGGGNLRAYNAEGTMIWEYDDGTENSFKALKGIRFDGDGNIYAAGSLNVDSVIKLHVMSFDPSHVLRWDFTSEVWGGVGTLAFNYDYSRIYAPLSRRMYCLNTADGSEDWEYQAAGVYGSLYIPVAPVVDNNQYIYFSTKENADSDYYCLNSDGSLRWSFPLYGDGYPSSILGSADLLYIGSEMLGYNMTGSYTVGETFRAINPATGAKIWGTQLSKDCAHSHPLLLNNGMLYIASTMLNSEKAIIYSIKTESAEGYKADAGNACFMDASNRSGSRQR